MPINPSLPASVDDITTKSRPDNVAAGIVGQAVDPVGAESDHFMNCPECGQSFDMGDLEQVLHHNMPGHQPLGHDA